MMDVSLLKNFPASCPKSAFYFAHNYFFSSVGGGEEILEHTILSLCILLDVPPLTVRKPGFTIIF